MTPATTYLSAHQTEEIFSDRDVPHVFNSYLAENVEVTVVGMDLLIGGRYKSMQAFHDAIYGRISDALKMDTVRVEVTRVIGGGDSPWVAAESLATATSKYDKTSHMEFVDLVRFNSQGKNAQLKKYFDNGHMHNHLTEHEDNKNKSKENGQPK
ncbi:MAG: hypothetical protein LQ345_001579 [Seirophora villosa]|nr:MAG: hypothetical protein LQ345_001579 [Seirophora villosa]